jgi:hypothetical protein
MHAADLASWHPSWNPRHEKKRKTSGLRCLFSEESFLGASRSLDVVMPAFGSASFIP